MFSPSASFASGLFLLLASPSLVHGFCSRFTQSGSTFTYAPASQAQIISAGVVCINSSTTNITAPAYGSCTNNTILGCNIAPSGSVTATGFTNLSVTLTTDDRAALFTLVGNLSTIARPSAPYTGLNQSMRGCMIPRDSVNASPPARRHTTSTRPC